MINPPVLITLFYLIGVFIAARWMYKSLNRISPGRWYTKEIIKLTIFSLGSWATVLLWLIILAFAGYLELPRRKRKSKPNHKYVEVNGKKWRVNN